MVDPHGIESDRTDDMAAMWRGVLRRSVSYLERGIAAVVVLLTLAVLLALTIAEIIASVGAFFERRGPAAGPLLVIGIIAGIRRLVVISAEAVDFSPREPRCSYRCL